MRIITITSAALTAVLLAGCGAATNTGAEQPAAAPSARESAPPADKTLGATQTDSDADSTVRATVYAYRQPLRSMFPPDRKGYVYSGADVRVCLPKIADGVDITVSAYPWSLEFADDTVIEPISSWSDDWFRVPLYPIAGRPVRAGSCVRGWIVFEVPRSKRPVRVVYAPDTGSADRADPLMWAIGR